MIIDPEDEIIVPEIIETPSLEETETPMLKETEKPKEEKTMYAKEIIGIPNIKNNVDTTPKFVKINLFLYEIGLTNAIAIVPSLIS